MARIKNGERELGKEALGKALKLGEDFPETEDAKRALDAIASNKQKGPQ